MKENKSKWKRMKGNSENNYETQEKNIKNKCTKVK